MTRGTLTAAVLAGVTVTAATVAYVATGSVPDFLVMLATTTCGGFLGLSMPGGTRDR